MQEEPATASEQTPDERDPAAKALRFPTGPGVYMMKDGAGNVIYVGKAKNLRSRASSYFSRDAANDIRIRDWIGFVRDIDFIETADPIAAMFTEARMVKTPCASVLMPFRVPLFRTDTPCRGLPLLSVIFPWISAAGGASAAEVPGDRDRGLTTTIFSMIVYVKG